MPAAPSFISRATTKVHTCPAGASVFLLCQVPTVVWQSSSEAAPCDIPMSNHFPLPVTPPNIPTFQQAPSQACFPPKYLQHLPQHAPITLNVLYPLSFSHLSATPPSLHYQPYLNLSASSHPHIKPSITPSTHSPPCLHIVPLHPTSHLAPYLPPRQHLFTLHPTHTHTPLLLLLFLFTLIFFLSKHDMIKKKL